MIKDKSFLVVYKYFYSVQIEQAEFDSISKVDQFIESIETSVSIEFIEIFRIKLEYIRTVK